jgi:hypothetical protein
MASEAEICSSLRVGVVEEQKRFSRSVVGLHRGAVTCRSHHAEASQLLKTGKAGWQGSASSTIGNGDNSDNSGRADGRSRDAQGAGRRRYS